MKLFSCFSCRDLLPSLPDLWQTLPFSASAAAGKEAFMNLSRLPLRVRGGVRGGFGGGRSGSQAQQRQQRRGTGERRGVSCAWPKTPRRCWWIYLPADVRILLSFGGFYKQFNRFNSALFHIKIIFLKIVGNCPYLFWFSNYLLLQQGRRLGGVRLGVHP